MAFVGAGGCCQLGCELGCEFGIFRNSIPILMGLAAERFYRRYWAKRVQPATKLATPTVATISAIQPRKRQNNRPCSVFMREPAPASGPQFLRLAPALRGLGCTHRLPR